MYYKPNERPDPKKNKLEEFLRELTFSALSNPEIDLIPVIKTEVVEDDPLNPTWERIVKKMQIVCNNDQRNLLKFTVKKHYDLH